MNGSATSATVKVEIAEAIVQAADGDTVAAAARSSAAAIGAAATVAAQAV